MTDPFPFDAAHVVVFHDACLESGKWPDEEAPAHPPGEIWPWIEENHGCNARMMREEERELREQAPHGMASGEGLARIDRQRKDAMARIDALLPIGVARSHDTSPPAQTPAMLIDQLSLLALRMKALAVEALRPGTGPASSGACRERLAVLETERLELAKRLQALLAGLARDGT